MCSQPADNNSPNNDCDDSEDKITKSFSQMHVDCGSKTTNTNLNNVSCKIARSVLCNEHVPTVKCTSKPTTKAERRALQEAQRAAKAAKKNLHSATEPSKASKDSSTTVPKDKCASSLAPTVMSDVGIKAEQKVKNVSDVKVCDQKDDQFSRSDDLKSKKSSKPKSTVGRSKSRRCNFSFLKHMKFHSRSRLSEVLQNADFSDIHTDFLKFGTRIMMEQVNSDEEKCFILLSAIQHLIEDFITPPNQDFPRALLKTLESNMRFLESCRPLTMLMTNCTWHIKMLVTQLFFNVDVPEDKARKLLVEAVKRCYMEKAFTAQRDIAAAILDEENDVICDGDTVLVVDCSPFIIDIIIALPRKRKSFQLLLASDNTFPQCHLETLLSNGIKFSVIPMDSLIYILNSVDRIIAGAGILFSDGRAFATMGLSQILELTSEQTTPLILCCETYKFTEEVVPDLMELNEMHDNPEFKTDPSDSKCLFSFSLKYDLIESERINRVICEMGELPPVACCSIYRLRIKEPTLPPLTSIS